VDAEERELAHTEYKRVTRFDAFEHAARRRVHRSQRSFLDERSFPAHVNESPRSVYLFVVTVGSSEKRRRDFTDRLRGNAQRIKVIRRARRPIASEMQVLVPKLSAQKAPSRRRRDEQ
jgi:hypothetical protein